MKIGAMKRIIAIIVAVILIMAPLSTTFATGTEIAIMETLNADTVLEWIVQIFRAWGIYSQYQEYEAQFEQWLLENLYDFLDSIPSIGSLQQWIMDWRIGYDPWGNYTGNSSFLEDVQDFFDYIEQKYNLTNNTILNLYTYSINDMTVYEFPFYAIRTSNNQLSLVRIHSNLPGVNPYAVFLDPSSYSGASTPFVVVDTGNGDNSIMYQILDEMGNSLGVGIVSLKVNYNNWGDTQPWIMGDGSLTGYTIPLDYEQIYTLRQIHDNLSGQIESSGITIVIGVLNPPDSDPSYTPGDSVTIVDDEPNYSVLEWPESISVDNLPAVISPAGTQDPGFSQVFLPVKAFVTTFGDSMAMIKDIAFRLPSQAWTIFYAILSITVIFGALNMFKEH